MEKKPYSPPTVTEHGKAVKETKGLGGKYFESFMYKTFSDFDDPKRPN